MEPDITCVGLTADEKGKVERVAGDIRRLTGLPVAACHAVGLNGGPRALCFTRADGGTVACVASDDFLAAADGVAAQQLTAW